MPLISWQNYEYLHISGGTLRFKNSLKMFLWKKLIDFLLIHRKKKGKTVYLELRRIETTLKF